jgi:hypothetical protein
MWRSIRWIGIDQSCGVSRDVSRGIRATFAMATADKNPDNVVQRRGTVAGPHAAKARMRCSVVDARPIGRLLT